jgi:hypothetical protein
MFETLTHDIGDLQDELERKRTQLEAMDTTITQQNEELKKLKYVEGRFLHLSQFASDLLLFPNPFNTSIYAFNGNIRIRMIDHPPSDSDSLVDYLKRQIYDSILEYNGDEDWLEIIYYERRW